MRIGILTSGGDCPGINATIRGVCKTAINHYGMEVIGIHSGFQGLLTKDIESFTDKSLSGLLNQGVQCWVLRARNLLKKEASSRMSTSRH
jgi:6-phosphofructokinase